VTFCNVIRSYLESWMPSCFSTHWLEYLLKPNIFSCYDINVKMFAYFLKMWSSNRI